VYKGNHVPAISPATFERVQELIHRPHSRRPLRPSFAFAGMIRCGECGFAVTAEDKVNAYGRRYVYYHCTHRRADYRCRQPVVSAAALEDQVLKFVKRLAIPERLVEWMGAHLRAKAQSHSVVEAEVRASVTRRLQAAEKERTNLIQLRMRELVGDAEFLAMRATLDREIIHLERDAAVPVRHVEWFELCDTVEIFISRAVKWFQEGGIEVRRAILAAVGSNFQLRDRIFSAEARLPFTQLQASDPILNGRAVVDDVRTLWEQNDKTLLDQIDAIRGVIARCDPSLIPTPDDATRDDAA